MVINAFSAKARNKIHETQAAGTVARGKKIRPCKDFKALFEDAKHVSTDGWDGFSASAIRNAMISACRLVGFKMTLAKLSVFVEADGYDRIDKITPLIRITKGVAEYSEMPARNDDGSIDLRARPMYSPGWEAEVLIRWDADQFSVEDVANLLDRVGNQVGIGEGRPDSKNSAGMGWGTFTVVGTVEKTDKKSKKT